MTEKLHHLLDQLKTQYDRQHRDRLRELAAAHRILTEFSILDVLDHITPNAITVSEDTLWQGANRPNRPADRYWIRIYLPASLKPLLRPTLIPLFDLQAKQYLVDKLWGITDQEPQLIERWLHKWDEIRSEMRAAAWNQITIDWYRPAIEGETVSGDCIIQRVTHHSSTTDDRLAVVCQKPDSN